MLVAVEAALGLVFDPRYRDIPFAPLTRPRCRFWCCLPPTRRPDGTRAAAETVAAAVLALSAGLHRVQRNLRQLAVGLVLRRLDRARLHSAVGAGRAKLRISTPAASAERSALCSTMPKAAAASATATSDDRRPQQVEQRRGQRHAAEHLMRGRARSTSRKVLHSQVSSPAWQASDMVEFSIAM